jgi:hypothetical protein
MTDCFVLYRFSEGDLPDTKIIGVYTSRQKAVNKMLKFAKREYNEWCEYKKVNRLTWDDFKIDFKQHMKKHDGYEGLFGMTYKITEKIIDE